MTVLEELLSKTEYIYVIGTDGRPQMPTKRKRYAVLAAVNLGDDTDTVGAITGGIAGIIYGLDAIPEEWVAKLVNKMMVFNAASDLYKRCNKDNIIDNLNFSV